MNSCFFEFRLGMTGHFRLNAAESNWERHCFLKLQFEDLCIYYSDPRRFGRIKVADQQKNPFSLGGFTPTGGFRVCSNPTPPSGYLSKPRIRWLLDTGYFTGVGNYMANEALGRLDLSPFLPCKDEREAIKILRECTLVAKESYKQGGNSFGTGFYNLMGAQGRYLLHCRYYQNPDVPRQIWSGRPVFTHFQKPIPLL